MDKASKVRKNMRTLCVSPEVPGTEVVTYSVALDLQLASQIAQHHAPQMHEVSLPDKLSPVPFRMTGGFIGCRWQMSWRALLHLVTAPAR